jgi:subtilisin family serine protease
MPSPLFETSMKVQTMRRNLLLVIAALLAACDGGGSGLDKPVAHPSACGTSAFVQAMSASAREMSASADEMDITPCEADTATGETEPLYTFQWALNYEDSYFNDFPETFGGGTDLNVEPAHRQGFKGQGVNVLVLDTGLDEFHEDLQPNFKSELSWSFRTRTHSPKPDLSSSVPFHGTAVAGIIAAAQNGKGVMGIAPRANLGGADYIDMNIYGTRGTIFAAYGGAPWSSQAHIFNASFGDARWATPYPTASDTAALQGLRKLRDGKGAVFVKAAGNEYDSINPFVGLCETSQYSCVNPVNNTHTLEPNVVVAAALNAQGSASTYSSAGSVIWVTGMGGEMGNNGDYGQDASRWHDLSGPNIFTTDISGCIHGESHTGANSSFLRGQTERDGTPDNPNCDYAYMGGTSSAAPTISGVAALVLGANPELTWRDVRDILRLSARKVDDGYELAASRRLSKQPAATVMDLRTNQLVPNTTGSASDIVDGATTFPPELGWQRNAAGHDYSNWYGFGVPDAEKAVALALEYKKDPGRSRSPDVHAPDFQPMAAWASNEWSFKGDPFFATLDRTQIRIGPFPYQQVTSAGKFKAEAAQTVDQFQVRLGTTSSVCLGSIGIAVRSPSGTTSLLKLPNDHFRASGISRFNRYTLGSYAFYEEPAQGDWELFVIAANPDRTPYYLYPFMGRWPCSSKGFVDLKIEARIIAQ